MRCASRCCTRATATEHPGHRPSAEAACTVWVASRAVQGVRGIGPVTSKWIDEYCRYGACWAGLTQLGASMGWAGSAALQSLRSSSPSLSAAAL